MQRKRSTRLALAVALAVGALGVFAGPAAAATTLSKGNGAFTATTTINPFAANGPCASYSNYQATLVFTVPPDTFGNYSGTLVANVRSTPGQWWGEFVDGTHPPVTSDPLSTDCGGAPAAISGFSGTITGTNGSQTVNCSVSGTTPDGGTYYRNGTRTDEEGLDITFTFNAVSGQCASATAPVTIKTSIVLAPTPWDTACNSPIAPQTCALGPARF